MRAIVPISMCFLRNDAGIFTEIHRRKPKIPVAIAAASALYRVTNRRIHGKLGWACARGKSDDERSGAVLKPSRQAII
jgi:hypothetical protein